MVGIFGCPIMTKNALFANGTDKHHRIGTGDSELGRPTDFRGWYGDEAPFAVRYRIIYQRNFFTRGQHNSPFVGRNWFVIRRGLDEADVLFL